MRLFSRIALPLLLMMSVSGCILNPDDDKDDSSSYNEPVLGEVYVGDEAYKAIGCGYNIYGNYADPTQVKGRVIEAYRLPDEYTVRTQVNHSVFSTEDGSSISEYQQHLQEGISVEVSYNAFSGAVTTNFSSDYYSYTNTSFATVMGKINKYQIAIAPNYARVDLLRPYMANQAAKDLNDSTIDANHIFRMYGTHVITGAMMGARLDFSVTMRTTDIKTGRSISVYAEAEYSSLFSKVSGSSSFDSDTERKDYESKRESKVNAIGGKSEYAQSIITKADYDQWISSIDGNEVFCDYTEDGLIPIWEFCDSPTRRNELYSYYSTWAANQQIATQDYTVPKDCILDIQVKDRNCGSSYDSGGLTYYKVNQDLNEGAGGADVFIYTAVGKDNSTIKSPITAVALLNGTGSNIKESCPHGYTLIDCDMNKDAGGQFIYLCISRLASEGAPVRRLEVWNRSDKDYASSYGADRTGSYYDANVMFYMPSWGGIKGRNIIVHDSMPLDLNHGAGGDFIYLLYSRQNNQ